MELIGTSLIEMLTQILSATFFIRYISKQTILQRLMNSYGGLSTLVNIINLSCSAEHKFGQNTPKIHIKMNEIYFITALTEIFLFIMSIVLS